MAVRALESQGVTAPHRARVAATAWLLHGVLEGGDLSLWDGPTLSWLVGHRDSAATMAMTTVTAIGGEVMLTAIAALTVLLLAVRRHRVEAFLLAASLGSALGRAGRGHGWAWVWLPS